MKGKILGVTVELDHLTNPDVAKKYEERAVYVVEQFHRAQECEAGSDGIKMQCEAVAIAFADLFGMEKTKEILGEQTNLFRCMDAFEEYVNLYPKQITPILEKRMEKYSRIRIAGR